MVDMRSVAALRWMDLELLDGSIIRAQGGHAGIVHRGNLLRGIAGEGIREELPLSELAGMEVEILRYGEVSEIHRRVHPLCDTCPGSGWGARGPCFNCTHLAGLGSGSLGCSRCRRTPGLFQTLQRVRLVTEPEAGQ